MRITDIKPLPVWVGNRNQLVVKVETDEGIYGLGESGLSGRELAVVGALKHFREFLIGKDPMQIGRIWQELYRGQYFEGGRVLLAAQSAIDIALYDIVGKGSQCACLSTAWRQTARCNSLLCNCNRRGASIDR